MLQNLIWLDDSILRGHTVGMQNTGPHSAPRTTQPFFLLSRPDLAAMLHNLLNYSRLEEENDILTSAPPLVKHALFGPSSCTFPAVIWAGIVLSFCRTNNALGGSQI